MIETLYQKMAIPDDCYLGKWVFKKLFHENAKLGITDKKAFREDIDTVTWKYTLKPSTIPIQAYEDSQREYHEVAILQVDLKTINRTNRIAEIIHRAIPYPVVVVFSYKTMCAISLAHKRFSQAEKGAIVADDFIMTDWIDLSAPTTLQQAFIESITFADLPNAHFFALYSALMNRLVALECARLSGKYNLETSTMGKQARHDRLALCHDIENQIAGIKVAIKKETQFNQKVDLNTKLKALEKQLRVISAEL